MPGSYDPQKFRQQLGRRLRALRRESGLTQAVVAKHAEIGNEFVSRLENGQGSPSLDTLGRLAAALDIPVAELFQFENETPSQQRTAKRLLRVLGRLGEEEINLVLRMAEQVARYQSKNSQDLPESSCA